MFRNSNCGNQLNYRFQISGLPRAIERPECHTCSTMGLEGVLVLSNTIMDMCNDEACTVNRSKMCIYFATESSGAYGAVMPCSPPSHHAVAAPHRA